jgi:hypothetical protein
VPDRIYAFWCRIPSRGNVGDALTPWLIRRVSGQYPVFVRPEEPRTKYFVSGSIAGYAREGCVVWGAGILDRTDRISPRATLLAVRGPLTREAALACGADCPEVYGDPALLLPRFYPLPDIPRRGMGLVPHFSDKPRLTEQAFGDAAVRLVDVQSPVETFVDQICRCEFVASSSLHGIIISHAYGIPAVWIKFRDLPSGDDSKFHDYFLSVGQPTPEPLRVGRSAIDPDRLAARTCLPARLPNLDRLWERCPFRLEEVTS